MRTRLLCCCGLLQMCRRFLRRWLLRRLLLLRWLLLRSPNWLLLRQLCRLGDRL